MRRRDFLRAGGIAAGSVFAGCSTEEGDPAGLTPEDQPWGLVDRPEQSSALLPAAVRPEGVFEEFMFGGLRPWDAFYSVPEYGDPAAGGPTAGWFGHLFADADESVSDWVAATGAGDRPLNVPFAPDSNGRMVHLGPWIWPLHDRPDILSRMRIVVMRHDQQPHRLAVPLALCGHPLANPRRAGTAAHVQRFFGFGQEPGQPFGVSTVGFHGPEFLDNVDSASSSGLHPTSARPLSLVLRDATGAAARLRRVTQRPDAAARAGLLRWYQQRMDSRFSVGGVTVRAPLLDEYAAAQAARGDSRWLRELLDDPLFTPNATVSAGLDFDEDLPRMGIDLGIRLLNDPQRPVRYALNTDLALHESTGGFAYDTHVHHVVETALNVPWLFQRLTERINTPGEGDAAKFDLDRHMIVLSTEMGRTPYAEGSAGTDHWPQGYVQVLIGGPIGPDQAGVAGALEPDGLASDYYTPAEFRAALLLAQGIWPFNPEAFAVADVRNAGDELEAALRLRQLLGHPA